MDLINLFYENIIKNYKPKKFFQIYLKKIIDMFKADSGSVFIYDRKNKVFKMVASYNLKVKNVKLREGERIVGIVCQKKEPLILKDASEDIFKNIDIKIRKEIKSSLIFPFGKNKECVAVVCLNRVKEDKIFKLKDLKTFQKMNNLVIFLVNLIRLIENQKENLFEIKKEKEIIKKITLYFHHEVLNFLFFLKQLYDMLKKEDIQYIFDTILMKIRYIETLSENVFNLTKIKKKKFNIPFDILNLLIFLKEHYQKVINLEGKKISLNLELKEKNLLVPFSYSYEIILRNLIENALKYTRDRIDIKAEKEDKYIKVLIFDNGYGIPENIFKTIKSEKSLYKKKGLGLKIVEDLVKFEKGKIEIKSSKDGTEVFLYFPIYRT